ncbi:MAG TPA: protein kinase [Gemmatimonadaceae bacterium]|jgi:tRNA A-37 threonylcarbamoyl transferase component Bud32/tetratricopeptide (TPR) repeat protein|nr:protein kinase [Gemmatimonadaceae bacterium]
MDIRDDLQSSLGAAYTLERELGGGGMSRVFVAEEVALGRKVVVKVLSPELLAGVNIDRFRREIQLAARLQQAQIVPVLAAGEIEGVPYYTMPFVEGESLRVRIARDGRMPVHDVVNILRDVTRALAYAHEHGVVHRDIKPDNVLLSGGTAVVTDFGIAKALSAAKDVRATDAGLTQLGTSVGTPTYISPEQAAGDPDVDARADIYSLGCMAYELLAGQPPFAGRTPQKTLVAHLTEKPKPLGEVAPDTPPALASLVMRMLEKEPAARPQSAHEIEAALDSVSTGSFANAEGGLFDQPVSAKAGMALYAGAFVAVALLAKASVIAFGLPDWVFVGAIGVMLLGLPVTVLAALGTTRHVTWSRTLRGGAMALGAFAVAVVAIMVLRLFGIGPAGSLLAAGTLKGTPRLIVVDFGAGKDSSLSHVVTEAVRTNLGQSQAVSIMPPAAIASALARMQRAPNTPVDLRMAQEIAQREGAKAIVAGDVTQLGSGYVVSLRLVSADSGAELAAYRATVDAPSQLLDAIDGLTRKLRGRIGESLKSVRDAPALDQVTTSSLDALRKYAEANRSIDLLGDYTKAIPMLREATRLDTNFAMAYRKLGVALINNGMPRAQSDSALSRAYALRDRLPEKEKYLAIATYYSSGPGLDRQKAIEALQQAVALDSTNPLVVNNLAAQLSGLRQYARAESLYHSINVTPRASQQTMQNEMSLLLNQGKVAAAESVSSEMTRRFPNALSVALLPANFMYMRGQSDSAEAFWRARTDDPNPVVKLTALSALTNFAILHGKLGDARRLSDEVQRVNEARGVPKNPLVDSIQSAAIDTWFLDQNDKAVHALDAALEQRPLSSLPVEQRPFSAFASNYALAGRPDKARAVVAQWDAAMSEPPLKQYKRISEPARHGVMAEILLAEKKPLEAVKEIWKSDSLPDGPASQCAHCNDLDLARTYDLANVPDSAIFYWERYLSEPFVRSWSRDAAYLGGIHKRLGELYDAKGDYAKAESHLTAFVDLWKNADPELQPKVADAKRRLAAIQAKEKR